MKETIDLIRKEIERLDKHENRVFGGRGGFRSNEDWNDGYDSALSAIDDFLDKITHLLFRP